MHESWNSNIVNTSKKLFQCHVVESEIWLSNVTDSDQDKLVNTAIVQLSKLKSLKNQGVGQMWSCALYVNFEIATLMKLQEYENRAGDAD